MATGTVKWFNSVKGYGFIQPSDGSKDAFVHISAVEQAGLTNLREGQKVEYELTPGRDGRASAENLVVLASVPRDLPHQTPAAGAAGVLISPARGRHGVARAGVVT